MAKRTRVNQIDFIEFPAKSVEDLNKAKTFYTNVFGWSYKEWGDDYCDTKDSGLGSGINADAVHRPQHPLAIIYTSELEETREKILSENGMITKDIFSFPGGRRFHFLDPSGNELAVWSDL